MNEARAQMAELPMAVNMWMNWMALVFMASLVFVKNHKGARYALAAFALTLPIAFLTFYLTRNVHLFSVPHFLVWIPLLVYFCMKEDLLKKPYFKDAYSIWLVLVSVTISVSLIFDVRDVYLVITGAK